MKRKSAVIEMGGVFGAGGPGDLFMATGRILGRCKKTGQFWVKSRHFETRLFDANDLLISPGQA